MFYFSQKYRVIDPVFKNGAPTKNIECLYNARVGRNPTDPFCQANGFPAGPTYQGQPHAMPAAGGIGLAPQQVLVNFLDNHDLPRFLFEIPDPAMLDAALFYLYTWDGIPCLYYGTEQGFRGGVDPKNREDMWSGIDDLPGFATGHPRYDLVRGLIALRREHEALRRGDVSITWSVEQPGARRDAGIFGFERSTGAEKVLVVLNASAQPSESCAPVADGGLCMQTSFAAGTVLEDLAPGSDGMTFTVAAGGRVQVSVPPRRGRILVAR